MVTTTMVVLLCFTLPGACLVPATTEVVVGISWPWDPSWDRTGIGLGRLNYCGTGILVMARQGEGRGRKERPSSLVRDVQINKGVLYYTDRGF